MQSGGPQLCRYIPVVGVTPLLRRSLVAADHRHAGVRRTQDQKQLLRGLYAM